jgi:hypothetical protein
MRILSPAECQEWLETNVGKGATNIESRYRHRATYTLPVDTGAKTALARAVSHSIDTARCGLFLVTGWGIFPSSQNMALFDAYRKSLGENRAIHLAPGHVFGGSDLEQLECLLGLTLYFYWDASLFGGTGTVAVKTSHDEFICFHARDEATLKPIQKNLDRLGLKEVERQKRGH